MLLKSNYQKEDDETLDIRLMALNCLTKTTVRSKNPIVHASFEHAGCYVFIREAKDDTPGQIYVGQTRYFDARFNGYERVEDYSDGMVILIHQRSKPGFDEADIQHLEYLLIDHFKDECFGSNFQLENKQSGTASVGHPTVHTAMEGVRDVVIHHLKSTFGLSLYSTGKNLSRLELIQAESSPPKKQKRGDQL